MECILSQEEKNIQNDTLRVDHLGIAVPDIEEAKKLYEALGFQACTDIIEVEEQSVRALVMVLGNTKIELLAPLSSDLASPIDSYIKSKPYTIYHIAYSTKDFDKQLAILQKKRFIMINEPQPSKVQNGSRTVFLFHRKMGTIEILEEQHG